MVTSELLIEEAILLEEGSHVELLEAHFVELAPLFGGIPKVAAPLGNYL